MDTISDDEEDEVQVIPKRDKGKEKADDQSQAFADSLFDIRPTDSADGLRKDEEVQFSNSTRTRNEESIVRRLQEGELAHSDSGNGGDFTSPADFPEDTLCRKPPEIGFDMVDFLSSPVPMLEIVVGTDASYLRDGWTIKGKLAAGQHTYHVFQFMLEYTSFYFEDVLKVPAMIRNCQSASNRLRANVIELPDVDPYMFGFLVQYLYTKEIQHRMFPGHANGGPCVDLGPSTDTMMSHSIKLWLLAENLEIPALMDYATFCIMTIYSLDDSNRLTKKWWKAAIGACNEDTLLWTMLVDLFAWDDDLFATLNDYAHWFVKNNEQPLHASTFREEPDTKPPDNGEWLLSNKLDNIWKTTLDSFLLSVNEERHQVAQKWHAFPIFEDLQQHCPYFDICNYYETELEDPYLPHEDFRRPIVHPSNPNAYLAETILGVKDELGEFSSHRYFADSLHHLQAVAGAGAKGLVYNEPSPKRPSPDQIRKEEEMRKTKLKQIEEMRMAKLKDEARRREEEEARRREEGEEVLQASKERFVETIKRIDLKHLAKRDAQIAKWKVEGKNELGQTPAQVKLLQEEKRRANVRKSERARMTNEANKLRNKYKEAQEISHIDGGASFRMIKADLEQLAKDQDIALKEEDIEIEKIERQLPVDFARQRYINDFNPYKDVLKNRVTQKKAIVPPHVLNPDGTTRIVEGGIYWLTGAAQSRFNKELKEKDNLEREQNRWIKTIEPEDCCKGPGACTGEVSHGAQFTFRDDKGIPLPPQSSMTRPLEEEDRGSAGGRGGGRGGTSSMPERPGSTTPRASQQRPPPSAAAVERGSGTSWRRGGAEGTPAAASSTSTANTPAATTPSSPATQTPTGATPIAPWATLGPTRVVPWAEPGPTPVAPWAPKTVAAAASTTPSAAAAPVPATAAVTAPSKSEGFQSVSDFAAKIVEESAPTQGAGRGRRSASSARGKGVDRPGSNTPRASQARAASETKAPAASAAQVKNTAPTPAVVVEEAEPSKKMNKRERRAWDKARREAEALTEAEAGAAAAAPEPSIAFENPELLRTPTPSVAAAKPVISKDDPATKKKPATPKTNPAASDDAAKPKGELTKAEQKRGDAAAAKELKAKEQPEREERGASKREKADAAAAIAEAEVEAQRAKDEEGRIAREAEEAAPRAPVAINSVKWSAKTIPEAPTATTSSAREPSSAALPRSATGPNSAAAPKALAMTNKAADELIQDLADFAAKMMHQFDPPRPEALSDDFQALTEALYRLFELLADPLIALFLKADEEKDSVPRRQALRTFITNLPKAHPETFKALEEDFERAAENSSVDGSHCDELEGDRAHRIGLYRTTPAETSGYQLDWTEPGAFSEDIKTALQECYRFLELLSSPYLKQSFNGALEARSFVTQSQTLSTSITNLPKTHPEKLNALVKLFGIIIEKSSVCGKECDELAGSWAHATMHRRMASDPKTEKKGDIRLLYKAEEGVCDHSFGVRFAELVRLTVVVFNMAKKKDDELEDLRGKYDNTFWEVKKADVEEASVLLKGMLEQWKKKCEDEDLQNNDIAKRMRELVMADQKLLDNGVVQNVKAISASKPTTIDVNPSSAPAPRSKHDLKPTPGKGKQAEKNEAALKQTNVASTSAPTPAQTDGFQSVGDFVAKVMDEEVTAGRGGRAARGRGRGNDKSGSTTPRARRPRPEPVPKFEKSAAPTKPSPQAPPSVDGPAPKSPPTSKSQSSPATTSTSDSKTSSASAPKATVSASPKAHSEQMLDKTRASEKPKIDAKPTPDKMMSDAKPKAESKPTEMKATPERKRDPKVTPSSSFGLDSSPVLEKTPPASEPATAPQPFSSTTSMSTSSHKPASPPHSKSEAALNAMLASKSANEKTKSNVMADPKPFAAANIKVDSKPKSNKPITDVKPEHASAHKVDAKPVSVVEPGIAGAPTKPAAEQELPTVSDNIEDEAVAAENPPDARMPVLEPAQCVEEEIPTGLNAKQRKAWKKKQPKARDNWESGLTSKDAGVDAKPLSDKAKSATKSEPACDPKLDPKAMAKKTMADAKPKLAPEPNPGAAASPKGKTDLKDTPENAPPPASSKPDTSKPTANKRAPEPQPADDPKPPPASYPKIEQKHATESMAPYPKPVFGLAPPAPWATGLFVPPPPFIPIPASTSVRAKEEGFQSAGDFAAKIVEESENVRKRENNGGKGMADAKPKLESMPAPDNTKPDAKPSPASEPNDCSKPLPEKKAPALKPMPSSYPKIDSRHATESMALDPKSLFRMAPAASWTSGLGAPPSALLPSTPPSSKPAKKDERFQSVSDFAAKVLEESDNSRGHKDKGGKSMADAKPKLDSKPTLENTEAGTKPSPDGTEPKLKPISASEPKHGPKLVPANTTPSPKPTPDRKPLPSSYPKADMKHATESMAPDSKPPFGRRAPAAPWTTGLSTPPSAPATIPVVPVTKLADGGLQSTSDFAVKVVDESASTRGSGGKVGKGKYSGAPNFKLGIEAFVADTLAEVTAKIDREGLVSPPRPPPLPTSSSSAITDRGTAAVAEVTAKMHAERAEADRKAAVESAFKLVEESRSYRGRWGRSVGGSGWGMADVRGRGGGREREGGADERPGGVMAMDTKSAAPTTQAVPVAAVSAAPNPAASSVASSGNGNDGAGSPVPPPVVPSNSFGGPRGRGRGGVWRGR